MTRTAACGREVEVLPPGADPAPLISKTPPIGRVTGLPLSVMESVRSFITARPTPLVVDLEAPGRYGLEVPHPRGDRVLPDDRRERHAVVHGVLGEQSTMKAESRRSQGRDELAHQASLASALRRQSPVGESNEPPRSSLELGQELAAALGVAGELGPEAVHPGELVAELLGQGLVQFQRLLQCRFLLRPRLLGRGALGGPVRRPQLVEPVSRERNSRISSRFMPRTSRSSRIRSAGPGRRGCSGAHHRRCRATGEAGPAPRSSAACGPTRRPGSRRR